MAVDENFGQLLTEQDNDGTTLNPTFLLQVATVLSTSLASLLALSYQRNKLELESSFAKLLAGFFTLNMEVWNVSWKNPKIESRPGARLTALGPHRTGWEAIAFASLLSGKAPRFLATDAFNGIPGVRRLLKMFNTLIVKAKAKATSDGNRQTRSANNDVIDLASEALDDEDFIVLFPQGNFSLIGQEPFRVYEGIAKIALKAKVPIDVYRLDGFWSLQNSWIPLSIRNNRYYRSMLSAFHPNSVRVTDCGVIDFHLAPQNTQSDQEKIQEICAILYAYYRHTEELNSEQIKAIGEEVTRGEHRPVWQAKLRHHRFEKAFKTFNETANKVIQQSGIFKRISQDAIEFHENILDVLSKFKEDCKGDCRDEQKHEAATHANRMLDVFEKGIAQHSNSHERAFLSNALEKMRAEIKEACPELEKSAEKSPCSPN